LYCEGDTVILNSNDSWIESYRWLIGDTLLSTDAELHMAFEPGFYNVVCQFSNPVCNVCEHKPIHISAAPNGSVVVQNDELVSLGDNACQWYFNNQPVADATQATVAIQGDGIYQEQWTNNEGCTAWSEELLISLISENERAINVYPNPAHGDFRLQLPQGNYSLELVDMSGRVILTANNYTPSSWVNVGDVESGSYIVTARNAFGVFSTIISIY
jgi:hypothetical protein